MFANNGSSHGGMSILGGSSHDLRESLRNQNDIIRLTLKEDEDCDEDSTVDGDDIEGINDDDDDDDRNMSNMSTD